MTKYIIEADGEVIGETSDEHLAEAMYDAVVDGLPYSTVTMYQERVTCH